MNVCFAHSRPGSPRSDWESLADHAKAVASLACEFAAAFGWEGAGRALGLLHDAGKASAEFQAYICGARSGRVDHSTMGARLAEQHYGALGRGLAACIAGHHAGLSDAEDLARRLDPAHPIPDASTWTRHIAPPTKAELRPTRTHKSDPDTRSFTQAFLVRMLFSCLVDADFLATEAFLSRGLVRRGVRTDLAALQDRLAGYIADLRVRADDSELNRIRAEILDHALAKAGDPPGLFTLTVPTGGGKTLASLRFSLAHALSHQKRRVIYVIPFTSIIEQTADVFRQAVGNDVVLEHHSSFDWEDAKRLRRADGGDERDGLGVLRHAAENWDAPIVVTTAVQFFESLFASRTSACRKLHNVADSVIVLDEAQTLPMPLLLPCLAALDELTRNYGASVVLCTATQPALRRQDGALRDESGRDLGLDIPDDRELAPRPQALYSALKRVGVEVLPGETPDEVIAERFAGQERMLCIVNRRDHARALFDRIAALPGAAHLSTLMCPAHRRHVLAELRDRLRSGAPVRLVATSLIEAGVDISFPEVWRTMAGVDSIAQAAGRCNREGELLPELGRVVVFTPADPQSAKPPRSLIPPQQAARGVLRDFADPLSLEAVYAFFRQLYFNKGVEALDAAVVAGHRGILPAVKEARLEAGFPFASIAEAFHLIDDVMQPVIVPWNHTAKSAIRAVAAAERPLADELRTLQQFTVGIPKRDRDIWLAAGVLAPVHRSLGEAMLCFADCAHYRTHTGVDLGDPMRRGLEDNMF